MEKTVYESPLCSRYASDEMQYLFSPDMRYHTWRRLWVALAKAEKELGLDITQEQIDELIAGIEHIDYEAIAKKEKETRHDVMSHIYGYWLNCPNAKGIIHLGATSCYVTDNADALIYIDALKLVIKKVLNVIANLAEFAEQYKDLPTLGYTHFQPAQPTTVGKRACLWIQDFMLDLEELTFVKNTTKLLGCKGTTGTQASFLSLFNGDHEKVKKLDKLIAQEFGMSDTYPVSGQTYPRKADSRILNVLSSVAQSAYRFANDMRLLQHMREIEEPFEKNQIGSSAMAYKRNPMRCERICSLSRYVITNAQNAANTAATQWLERTLDDSANRRISLPEGFLAIDAVLNLMINVTSGLVVYPKVIEKNLMEFLPFIATENLLMSAAKAGGDRQEMHEIIRKHSMDAAARMKLEGKDCDLLHRLANDTAFILDKEQIESALNPKDYVGRAPQQVTEYLNEYVYPALKANDFEKVIAEVNV
jgi:adenylosuccinate lyase